MATAIGDDLPVVRAPLIPSYSEYNSKMPSFTWYYHSHAGYGEVSQQPSIILPAANGSS